MLLLECTDVASFEVSRYHSDTEGCAASTLGTMFVYKVQKELCSEQLIGRTDTYISLLQLHNENSPHATYISSVEKLQIRKNTERGQVR